MRLPIAWLHEYARPELTTAELATRLAMTGTEVDRIHRHGVDALEHFVVGRVLRAQQHPNADRLKVCDVAVGEGDVAHIVCGAPNVAEGQTVAVARPGAIMPDGTRLKKAKLRGEPSEGMILAEDELAIGTDHSGIIVFEDDGLIPGTPLIEVLPLATDVLELEITPNRPDCLSVYGVAREVHAATGAELAAPPWEAVQLPAPGDGPVAIEVRDPDGCPRFTALAYEDVTIAESPAWLKARLMAAGQRPISNVVDITNYVMLLTGQPLHAFDVDRVAGGRLTIRRAAEGEQVVTLDGQARRMPAGAMVIDDGDGPTSIAGIMGGERSEVHDGTTRVLMEAASWVGPNIHATSAALALRTEASGRFEKGLSPEATLEAQAVAHALMVELCGATPVGGLVDAGGAGPEPAVIRVRAAKVAGLLGVAVERDRQREVLEALGFGIEDAADGLDVAVPHWRRLDVTREADVVEEIARLAALDDLPATLPSRRGASGRLSHAQKVRRRAEDALVGRGASEVAGWSFASPALLDRLRLPADSPLRRVVELDNPMSEDEAILRPTILGSLLDAAAHNAARGRDRLALFETGAVYRAWPPPPRRDPSDPFDEVVPRGRGLPPETPADEHLALGLLLIGPLRPASWRSPQGDPADVFAAKALLAAVLDTVRVDWEVVAGTEPYLHPGRSAEVRAGGVRLGWLGEVHPLVVRAWDLPGAAAFAIDLGKVAALAPETTRYADVTSFPPVRQDIAVVVDAATAAGAVLTAVRDAGGALLRGAEVFDRYEMDDGRVSLAVHLEFAAPDRTLTDEEVAGRRERIVAALGEQLGATLRG